MGLTYADGPLSPTAPTTVNYAIDGPAHKLLMHPFPRRVRAEFAGATILDTRGGVLLHETALLPRLYVGAAAYRSVRLTDGRTLDDAAWVYPAPLPESVRIGGRLSFLHEDLTILVDGEPA